MATAVTMPLLGLTMESGTIVEWMKKEGDPVHEGDILFTVETDKSVMEVEAKVSGTLLKILKAPGEAVPVTHVIGYIGAPGEAVPGETGQPAVLSGRDTTTEAAAAPHPVERAQEDERIKASPAARKLAKELGVPIGRVTGTGPGGRITREDVERSAAAPIAAPAAAPAAPPLPQPAAAVPSKRERARTPLTGKRKVAARRLTESKTTAPHFYLTVDIDMTKGIELREALIARSEAEDLSRPSFTDIFIKAAGIALREFPAVNASLDSDTIVQYEDVNVGFAVALDDGLVVPVVSQADRLSIFEVARTTQELEARAKTKGLVPGDYGHGTFTISNLGMFGVDNFTAIINPPEAAILAVGRIKKVPVVLDDQVVVRSLATVTLSSDHRVIDGAIAARFLGRLRRILEQPLELLIQT